MTEREIHNSIKELWKEAFGDSDEFIDSFLERFHTPGRMLAVWENGKLLSMLHVLPFVFEGYRAGYIYGVATAQDERDKGHATRLMQLAVEQARRDGLDALVTIPASESLRGYYARLGFRGRYPVTFTDTGDFDPGTGDSSMNIAAVLPLKEISLPGDRYPVTLEWIG